MPGGYQIIEKDNKVFDYIEGFIACYGISPTVREIVKALSLSSSSVTASLRKLRRVGYIDYEDGKSRTIVIPRYVPIDSIGK